MLKNQIDAGRGNPRITLYTDQKKKKTEILLFIWSWQELEDAETKDSFKIKWITWSIIDDEEGDYQSMYVLDSSTSKVQIWDFHQYSLTSVVILWVLFINILGIDSVEV